MSESTNVSLEAGITLGVTFVVVCCMLCLLAPLILITIFFTWFVLGVELTLIITCVYDFFFTLKIQKEESFSPTGLSILRGYQIILFAYLLFKIGGYIVAQTVEILFFVVLIISFILVLYGFVKVRTTKFDDEDEKDSFDSKLFPGFKDHVFGFFLIIISFSVSFLPFGWILSLVLVLVALVFVLIGWIKRFVSRKNEEDVVNVSEESSSEEEEEEEEDDEEDIQDLNEDNYKKDTDSSSSREDSSGSDISTESTESD